MARDITALRERIRDMQNELDNQRAENRRLAASDTATAQEIDAAMEATRRIEARVRIMQDDLNAEEAHQREALQGRPANTTDNGRRELLASREYARAFAFAIRNGLNRKNGRRHEETKILFDALTEGTGADGGFLVPEDIDHQIRELKRALNPLAPLFNEETVSAPTGWRVVDTAPSKGLVDVEEMGQIDDDDDQPVFAKVSYTTSKKALILPVSNELLNDNVANLFAYISRWYAKKLVITENQMLIAAVRTLTATSINSDPLGGIKKALNVGLDPAISAAATIICNQTGLDVLDQVLDGNDRPMLQPDPTNSTILRIKGRPVHPVSDACMGNIAGTSPAPDTSDIFIGDGKEFATLFRCGGYELASTDVGGSAWRTDSTEFRGIVRLGVTKFDASAMVRRSVNVPA